MPVVEAVKGAPALITLASYLVAVIPLVTRAAMPIPATTVAQTSDTTTTLRWVGSRLKFRFGLQDTENFRA